MFNSIAHKMTTKDSKPFFYFVIFPIMRDEKLIIKKPISDSNREKWKLIFIRFVRTFVQSFTRIPVLKRILVRSPHIV